MKLLVGKAERLDDLLAERRGGVLLVVRYGGPACGIRDADHPFVDVPNAVLDDAPWGEIWFTEQRAACFHRDGIVWAEEGRALFGCACRPAGEDIEATALEIYRELLALLEERGYPFLQRVWNYIPRINESQRGVERYKLFNAGRARGFEDRFGNAAEERFSAASAVGTIGESIIVCFAAARVPGAQVENPRQISAYRYPPRYGPRSPSFTRGTLAPADWGRGFFLSGTASVVGHRSTHIGDPMGQLEETLTNIVVLLAGMGVRAGRGSREALRFDLLKAYVRHREHFPAIRDALVRRLDPATPAIYLLTDVCRAELLLEIEGVVLEPPA